MFLLKVTLNQFPVQRTYLYFLRTTWSSVKYPFLWKQNKCIRQRVHRSSELSGYSCFKTSKWIRSWRGVRRRVVKIRSISRLIPRLLHRNVNPQESQPEISSTREKKKEKKKGSGGGSRWITIFSPVFAVLWFPPSRQFTRAHTRAGTDMDPYPRDRSTPPRERHRDWGPAGRAGHGGRNPLLIKLRTANAFFRKAAW